MTTEPKTGMGARAALRMEYAIIGLGILALVLIFQPFSLGIFAFGGVLVVIAGLVNNLLPLARSDVSASSVVKIAMVVAMIFCIVLLLSIIAAWAYGALFLAPPDPNTAGGKAMLRATPFYMHSFTWTVAAIGAALAALIALTSRRKD
jgi:hypothetical protein